MRNNYSNIKFIIFIVFLGGILHVIYEHPAKAETQAACAIWICLPGGFPSGCSAAYNEFKYRIKNGKPPLPDLSACTTGPHGDASTGRYQMGQELWYPCKEGYILKELNIGEGAEHKKGRCYSQSCFSNGQFSNTREACPYYSAKKRPKPNYIKMWIDGSYIGQYFY